LNLAFLFMSTMICSGYFLTPGLSLYPALKMDAKKAIVTPNTKSKRIDFPPQSN